MLAICRFLSSALNKDTSPDVRSKIRFRRNSSLQSVCDTPIARITGCVKVRP